MAKSIKQNHSEVTAAAYTMQHEVEATADYEWILKKDMHKGLKKALTALNAAVAKNKFGFILFSIKNARVGHLPESMRRRTVSTRCADVERDGLATYR